MKARDELLSKLRNALEDRGTADKLWGAMTRARESRAEAIQKYHVDVKRMKERNRSIKLGAAGNPEVVERFAQMVRRNGGRVFFAKTGNDAVKYASEVAKRTNCKLIVKSKSLTSDEISFNHEIEKEGIRSVETDLGELIVQLAHELPVHLVMPAAHKSVADVAKVISQAVGEEIPADHNVILKAVRRHLRPIFLSADMGVTGANVGVAETGSILLETNEGNARLVTSIPRIHVVIIGLEKIVSSWEDVASLVEGHAVNATGQRTTVYVSAITQHVPLAGSNEGREFHVIILDNGRSKMRDDPWFSDALNCIRCGACMNICPTYGIATGHTFGYIYPGPIGIPWTANVHGLDKATFAHLCISCGLCKEICPIDIDMPMMIAKVKEKEVEQNGQLTVNSFFAESEKAARLASATAPVSNWMLRRYLVRYLMEKVVGVDRRRTLPSFSRKRLRARLKGMKEGSGTRGKVIFFPDVYADYNDPELGAFAIELLRRVGFLVEVPNVRWSGMPYVSYGELEKAKKLAEYNLRTLRPYVEDGYQIVSTEPTVTYMFREVYPKLVPGEFTETAARQSFAFFDFLESSFDQLNLEPVYPIEDFVGFHIPCHYRTISNGIPARRFLEKAGYDVRVLETGTCCGMAGTFGMKHGDLGYNLSMAVGERLFQLFRDSDSKVIATESSVCAMQLSDGVGVKVLHPLHMIRR